MKVLAIDFEKKTFETDGGETFPFVFDIDESISLEVFQSLVDESERKIREIIGK